MLQYILGSWDRSYKALNKSEQEDKDAIFREWNRSIRGMWQKSVTELTMLNIQVPISLLCYVHVYPNLSKNHFCIFNTTIIFNKLINIHKPASLRYHLCHPVFYVHSLTGSTHKMVIAHIWLCKLN